MTHKWQLLVNTILHITYYMLYMLTDDVALCGHRGLFTDV